MTAEQTSLNPQDTQPRRRLTIFERLYDPTLRVTFGVQSGVQSRVSSIRPTFPKKETIQIDPFAETKKRCLPVDIEDSSPKDWVTMYCTVAPFTIEEQNGPSFIDDIMNNLIIDADGKLLQLFFAFETQDSLPPNQECIEVMEYCNPEGNVIARKFVRYSNTRGKDNSIKK